MNGLPTRPPGPQPVLDHFLETDGGASQANGQPEQEYRPASGSRADNVQTLRFPLNRSSTHLLGSPRLAAERDRSASPVPRPGLLRAKSDFGPRRDETPKHGDTDSKTSGEGEWGIRHGFEMQLVSEEYNNLLTSVSLPGVTSEHVLTNIQEFLPLLYRQEARNWRKSQIYNRQPCHSRMAHA
jgi:regulator-associated protein of mTOR